MKLTLGYLRIIINEELDRMVRWSAGFGSGAGAASMSSQYSSFSSLPGLGDESNIEYENEEEEEEDSKNAN